MIRGIHHVQITVPADAQARARVFYTEVLGLEAIDKPEALRGRGGFWLKVGARQVHVGVEEGVERARTKAHVAYEVDDLEAIRQRLIDAGITPKASVPIPGFARFEIRDPFGNRVELIQPL